MNEKKAIEIGKTWMKKSKDPIHGYEHAENVEKYGFEIFKSLKENEWDVDMEIDENLISLCAWWHDSYKALFEKKLLINELFEGVRSAEIAKEELKNFVPEKRLKMILDAIRIHNNFVYLLFAGKRLPILTRILIEADTIDAKDYERKMKKNASPRSIFHKIAIFFAEPLLSVLQRIYIKSPYARKCLWS